MWFTQKICILLQPRGKNVKQYTLESSRLALPVVPKVSHVEKEMLTNQYKPMLRLLQQHLNRKIMIIISTIHHSMTTNQFLMTIQLQLIYHKSIDIGCKQQRIMPILMELVLQCLCWFLVVLITHYNLLSIIH